MLSLTIALLLASTPPDGCKKADATIAKASRQGALTMFVFCDGAKAVARDGKVMSLMVNEAEARAWADYAPLEISNLQVAEHNNRELKTAATSAVLARAQAAYDAKQKAFRKSWSKAPYERAVKSYKGVVEG